MSGTISQAGTTVQLDIHVDGKSGAYGTIALGIRMHIITVGRAIYFKAAGSFYADHGTPSQVAHLQTAGG